MITAAQVNELRKMTGAGMMDCKKALTESNGDMDEAVTILRKKGAAKAASKSDRETSEGFVFAAKEGNKAALVAIGCETDFVAKNDKFQEFGNAILKLALENADNARQEAESKLPELIGTIGENMKILGVESMDAPTTGMYVHSNNKIGVLVGLDGGTEEVAADIAMHAAAMNPQVLNPSDVDESLVEKEKEIWTEQLKKEGKPENIMANIMMGKEKKFRAEVSLTSQAFVKDPNSTVEQYAKNNSATVTQFVRLSI